MNLTILMTIASLDLSTGGPSRSVPFLGEAISQSRAVTQLFVNNNQKITEQENNTVQTSLSVKTINKLDATLKEFKKNNTGHILIHNHGIWLPINHYASVTARRFNIPLIISPRGMLEPWARSYRSWKKNISWYLYQRRDLKMASAFHATSKQEAKNLQSLGFQIPIAVIPNGVDIPALPEPATTPRQTKTVLFLSRIHPIKGLINLIRAWSKVNPVGWKVVIAGPDEGHHKAEVEQEIKRHDLIDTFSFIGPVENHAKWKLYKSADLFILPTHSENFGIVVAEALASGLPVITTKGAPWADLDKYQCGWWIDIGVEPLVQAISDATKLPPETLFSMGQRGRTLVADKYSWNTIAQDMISVYEWILHGGTLPKCVIIN